MTLLGKTSVVILLENQQQKQEEPVHQWRQKNKSRNQTKKTKRTSNKKPVNFDSNKSTRSATFSDTSNNSDGNELRLAATILDECETEVKIFKIVKFNGEMVFCFQNCSDLLWEKNGVLTKKPFELKAKVLSSLFRTIYSKVSKFLEQNAFLTCS